MLEDPSLFPFSIQFQSNQPSIKPETSPYFFLSHLFPNFPKNWMKEQIKRKKNKTLGRVSDVERRRSKVHACNELVTHCCLRVSRVSGWGEA